MASRARPRRRAKRSAASATCWVRSRSGCGGREMTRARSRHPWLTLAGGLGLAVALVVPAATLVAAQPSAPSALRPAALAPSLPAGAARVGSLDAAQPLALAVVLPPSHPAEFAAVMHDLYDPASPQYEHWL